MTARDFAKSRMRQRIARKGSEAITGGRVSVGPPAPRPTKAQLRAEANAAFAAASFITMLIECRCGHKGKVRIPVSRANGRFRCVICGSQTS